MCAKSICGNDVTFTTSYGASKKIKAGTKAHAAHAEPFTIVDFGERIHAPHSQPSLQQESTASFSFPQLLNAFETSPYYSSINKTV